MGSSWSHILLSFLEPVRLGTMSFNSERQKHRAPAIFQDFTVSAYCIPLSSMGPTGRLIVGRTRKHIPPQSEGQLRAGPGLDSSCLLKSFGTLSTSIYPGLGETCLIRETAGSMA